ncbi:MAG: 4Fe-4S dicluster domain-containing protein [Candidatus Methanoplasma sp.]|jgi:Fe-S oxidoreductase|nr:4Fe-4S dicluster domain-containing protein [Candidatus Methanoplasma sp.]
MKALENPFSKLKDAVVVTKMPRIQQELTACLQCGYCISVCEAHEQTPWESVTPRGKIYYLNQLSNRGGVDKLLGREVSLSPYFVDAMYRCTGCGNCEAVCHANIPLVEFWETVRKWMVDEGAGPMTAHKGMAKKVGEVHNPYGEPPSKRGDWWPEDVKRSETPEVLFFAGCTGAYRQQTLPQTGVRILARAGVTVNTLGTEEWCCSSPLLRTGTHRHSLECTRKAVEGADGMGAKDMVMTCSGCYKTVSTDFGKFYAKAGQNVYHLSQYVEKLIAERKLPINHEFKAKVTYHDPCHMGRHMGVFDAPRNVLKKIKGIELVEMTRTKENSRCCGAGGGYKSQYNDMAVNIAAERIRDAEETGAEILVTCCPFCVVNLTQGAKQINSKIQVMDLAEILLKVTEPAEAKPPEDKKPEPPKAKAPEPSGETAVAVKERPAPPAVIEVPKPAVTEAPKEAVKPKVEAPKPEPAVTEAPKEAVKPKIEAPKPEPVNVPAPAPEAVEEEMGEDLWTDNSPEALVRRAAWNKGLRCRKDYGPLNIQVAFVKSKVAVYVLAEGKVDAGAKKELEEDGWIVLSFTESSITDGEAQAVEIKAAVKENLKAIRKKKI